MFKKEAKTILTFSLAAFFIALLAAFIGTSFFGNACKNSVIAELASPNKKYKIIIFSRDCGATTGFSTQVSILSADESIKNKPGNIFIADPNHGKAQSGPGGGPMVNATWITDNTVVIKFHDSARTFKELSNHNGIQIHYDKIRAQLN